ncbi:MAG: YiiX/YebB-like N1pC/P60 family cysteine hydrolase [Kofleriaceae bacterium]
MKPSVVVVLVSVALVSVALSACGEPKSFLVHRPEHQGVDEAVSEMWTAEIRHIARDGDWLLTRSYYAVGDAIALVTPGEDLSHASIYDATHNTVIESIGSGVREIPLRQLVDRNHYLIVVRPGGMTEQERRESVDRARTKVGVEFDVGGLFGFDDEDRFYCSELVYWAAQTEARTGDRHAVITPADLMKYGEVVYWSGQRTDAQIMDLAVAKAGRADPPMIRTAAAPR